MKVDKILYYYIPILLFLITPFLQSYNDIDKADVFGVHMLPTFVSTVAGFIRWSILGLSIIFTIFIVNKNKLKITKSVFFLSLVYIVQLIYALGDSNDIIRFLLMFSFAICTSYYLSLAYSKNKIRLLKSFNFLILFFLILGLVLNGHLILSGYRFLGFSNNSNLFGFTALFWVLIVYVSLENGIKNKLIWTNLFLLVIVIFFSGSRNALLGLVILSLFYFSNHIIYFIISILSLSILFFLLQYYIDLSMLIDRFINIGSSVKDSGRDVFWNRAYPAIDNNFYWGNGMDANELIAGTGNMHNVYIRYMLNMGLIFTVLTLIPYALSIISILENRGRLNFLIFGFMLVYTLVNIGEDFMVGIGNSAFIYLLIVYAIINSLNNDISR